MSVLSDGSDAQSYQQAGILFKMRCLSVIIWRAMTANSTIVCGLPSHLLLEFIIFWNFSPFFGEMDGLDGFGQIDSFAWAGTAFVVHACLLLRLGGLLGKNVGETLWLCLQNLHLGPSVAPGTKVKQQMSDWELFWIKYNCFSDSCSYNGLLYKSFNRKDECVSACVEP